MAYETAPEVRAHLGRLHESVWELAALAVALGPPGNASPEQRRAAADVLTATGLIVDVSDGAAAPLAAQARTAILQAAAFLSGADAWSGQDDEAILAQGRASAQAAPMFKALVLPALDGLAELFQGPAPVMLDVGVGIAAMAAAFCAEFPALRVVGLDVFDRALALARRTVADAGLSDRVELRHQDVATLADDGVYALAWLPAPFLPEAVLRAAVPRVVRSLVPGGWVMVGHGRLTGDAASVALTRFQTTVFGGTALTTDDATALLEEAGLELVRTLPTPEGAPLLTVGRRPLGG